MGVAGFCETNDNVIEHRISSVFLSVLLECILMFWLSSWDSRETCLVLFWGDWFECYGIVQLEGAYKDHSAIEGCGVEPNEGDVEKCARHVSRGPAASPASISPGLGLPGLQTVSVSYCWGLGTRGHSRFPVKAEGCCDSQDRHPKILCWLPLPALAAHKGWKGCELYMAECSVEEE